MIICCNKNNIKQFVFLIVIMYNLGAQILSAKSSIFQGIPKLDLFTSMLH